MTNTDTVLSDPIRATYRGAVALDLAMRTLRHRGISVWLIQERRPRLFRRGVYAIAFAGSVRDAETVELLVEEVIEQLRVSA